jgi:toxin ParE1/3/4
MRLRWTRPALTHLRKIAAHIVQENPPAARKVVGFIRAQATLLGRYPGVGRAGRIEGTRELVIGRFPYIVVYRAHEETVEIVAVIHTSRRWPAEL